MKPDNTWIEEWRLDEDPAKEDRIARELLAVFVKFWEAEGLDEKSKSTKRRYSAALHSLGGYLVEKAVLYEEDMQKTTKELLDEYVGPYEGPLICQDNEIWQNEIDTACRKLYKFRRKTADIIVEPGAGQTHTGTGPDGPTPTPLLINLNHTYAHTGAR